MEIMDCQTISDLLEKAIKEGRQIPFEIEAGAVTIQILTMEDLITTAANFRRMAIREAAAAKLGEGLVTR